MELFSSSWCRADYVQNGGQTPVVHGGIPKEMAGIYTTSVNKGTLDEAPMAYKSLDDILAVIRDTADVLEVMKPVYNFKAS